LTDLRSNLAQMLFCPVGSRARELRGLRLADIGLGWGLGFNLKSARYSLTRLQTEQNRTSLTVNGKEVAKLKALRPHLTESEREPPLSEVTHCSGWAWAIAWYLVTGYTLAHIVFCQQQCTS
jgi:hypothetical protein